MSGGKVVVRFRVAEVTKRHTGLAVQQSATPRVPETQCQIGVPKVPRFESRELSRVTDGEVFLHGGVAPLHPRPEGLTLDADDEIVRGLIVAASLTAGHAATGR